MHNTAVIDASIIVKWFVAKNEQGAKEARLLHRLLTEEKIILFAPRFLIIEILNILVNRHHVPLAKVKRFLSRLVDSGIQFEEIAIGDMPNLVQAIQQYWISSYDALYVQLAQRRKIPLLTEDKQLLSIKEISINLADFFTSPVASA